MSTYCDGCQKNTRFCDCGQLISDIIAALTIAYALIFLGILSAINLS